jgi:hypothetical protein
MLETIFIILLVIAILFLVLTVVWNSLSIGILDIMLWFILSGAIHSIEIPYVAIQNDNTIVEGIQVIESLYPLSWLFIGIGIIVLMYWLTSIVWPMYQDKYSNVM